MNNNPTNIMTICLPEDWAIHRFDEISAFDKKTVDPLKKPDQLFNYITISDIQDYRIKSSQEIIGNEAPSRARKKVVYGDIIVSTVRPYLKALARIDKRHESFICSTGFSVISPNEKVLSDYLYFLIQTDQFTNELMKRMVGATYPAITSSDIKHLNVPVPPLIEQRGIVEVLGTVDECIRLTNTVLERAEELKRGLTQQLLTKGIGHTEYKETQLGKIPKTWNIMRLKQLLHSMRNGVNYSKDDFGRGVKFVNVSDIFIQDYINNEKLDRINISKKTMDRYVLEDGDVLLVRSSLKKEGVAYPAIFKSDNEPTVFCGFLIRLKPKKNIIDPYYLMLYLKLERTRNWLISGSGTVAITNVSQESLNPLQVIVPSLKEQKHIVQLIKCLNQSISFEANNKVYFTKLKQGLLQLLLTGKIRVEMSEDGLHRIRDGREAHP